MAVALVIPCRNEAGNIATLLEAITNQDMQPDEVVVVDDASTDNTAAVVDEWLKRSSKLNLRHIRISDGPIGAGAAMNEGIRQARADVIIRLDGHSRPAPDYVRRSIEALARDQAGVVGGTWTVEPGADTRMARVIAAVVSHRLGSGGAAYRHPSAHKQIRRVDTVPFGCFRRSLWEQLGGFDEQLLGNEDYDFNHRARLAAYDVVLDPAITSVYYARPTLGALARQYYRYGFWKLRMLRKFPAALRWRQLVPGFFLPVITFLAVLALIDSLPAALALAVYLAVVAVGALQIAGRIRDAAAVGHAFVTIVTVHLMWSAGFWVSIFTPAASASPRGR
jgi:succinoglycan biosynthesis protein ExoA